MIGLKTNEIDEMKAKFFELGDKGNNQANAEEALTIWPR